MYTILAEKTGIRLVHIYEYEWTVEKSQEKIKQYLNTLINQPVDKIYADDCIIKQLANAESQMLNEKFNLNGHSKAQITYGLYYNKNLVQLMSFNKIKHTDILNLTDSVWEIISVSSVPDKNIIGGIQKLLNYFIKHHQSKAFLLYCDFNKFDGKFWENIGMNFIGYTAPDVKWVLPGNVVVDKINHKLKNMPSRGKIYGAGYKKYIYYVY